MAYLRGLFGAITGGIGWWLSLLFAYFFQIAAFSDYDRIRDEINSWQSAVVMPPTVPIWMLIIPLLIWVIARLAHNEAMRYWRAARINFGAPYVDTGPLYNKTIDVNGQVRRDVLHNFNMAKINVENRPFKLEDGRDVVEAWSEIEIFDLYSKLLASWKYGRWEENNQPGYGSNPVDHYPDKERVRTLSANGRPHILCVAYKPIGDEWVYPLRGEDQLKPGWRATDIKLPSGEFLLRIRISGKGLQAPAEKTLLLKNGGALGFLELTETNKKVGRNWPR